MKNTVLFLFLLLVSVILIVISDKKNKKFLMILAALILSVLAGFRGVNVGFDTSAYHYAFINHFPKSWQFEEVGFRAITNGLMSIFNNSFIVMFIYALITNVLVFLSFWRYKKKCNFSIMGILYILIYFLSSMNIMRQFVAVAIILYSTALLEKKNYLLFFLITLGTSLIHKTALLSFVLIFIYCWSDLSKSKKIIFGPLVMAIFSFGLYYILGYENDHISNYLAVSNSVNNINLTFMYRVFIFFLSYILFRKNIRINFRPNYEKKKNMVTNIVDYKEFNKISIIYFLGLIFSSLGLFYGNMSRVGLYYLIFEIFYWGYISKNSNNKKIIMTMILIYALYVFMFEIIYNGSMIFPYYFMNGGY